MTLSKLLRLMDNSFVLAQSDKENNRSLDFFKLDSKLEKLGRKKLPFKRAFIKQWDVLNKDSYFILSSVSALGDKFYLCK